MKENYFTLQMKIWEVEFHKKKIKNAKKHIQDTIKSNNPEFMPIIEWYEDIIKSERLSIRKILEEKEWGTYRWYEV